MSTIVDMYHRRKAPATVRLHSANTCGAVLKSSSIKALLRNRGPPTILRRVTLVVVNAIQTTRFGRLQPHIVGEILKFTPALADVYTSRPIMFIGWIIWVATSLFQANPCVIQRVCFGGVPVNEFSASGDMFYSAFLRSLSISSISFSICCALCFAATRLLSIFSYSAMNRAPPSTRGVRPALSMMLG